MGLGEMKEGKKTWKGGAGRGTADAPPNFTIAGEASGRHADRSLDLEGGARGCGVEERKTERKGESAGGLGLAGARLLRRRHAAGHEFTRRRRCGATERGEEKGGT